MEKLDGINGHAVAEEIGSEPVLAIGASEPIAGIVVVFPDGDLRGVLRQISHRHSIGDKKRGSSGSGTEGKGDPERARTIVHYDS